MPISTSSPPSDAIPLSTLLQQQQQMVAAVQNQQQQQQHPPPPDSQASVLMTDAEPVSENVAKYQFSSNDELDKKQPITQMKDEPTVNAITSTSEADGDVSMRCEEDEDDIKTSSRSSKVKLEAQTAIRGTNEDGTSNSKGKQEVMTDSQTNDSVPTIGAESSISEPVASTSTAVGVVSTIASNISADAEDDDDSDSSDEDDDGDANSSKVAIPTPALLNPLAAASFLFDLDRHPPVSSGEGRTAIGKKNARVSCHQCKTTKADGLLIFCTTKAEKGKRKRKCRKKYCDACLRRSYNIAITSMSQTEIANYCCPACLGTCSCAACQRKHLEAMIRKEQLARAAALPANTAALASVGSAATAGTNPASTLAAAAAASATVALLQAQSKARPTAAVAYNSMFNMTSFLSSLASNNKVATATAATEVTPAIAANAPAMNTAPPAPTSAEPQVVVAQIASVAPTAATAATAATNQAVIAATTAPFVAFDSIPHATTPLTSSSISSAATPTTNPLQSPEPSQPSPSPSISSTSSTASFTRSLAALSTASPMAAASLSEGPSSNGSNTSESAAIVPMMSDHHGMDSTTSTSLLTASAVAKAHSELESKLGVNTGSKSTAASSTQAEIEEKTKQLQELINRRMAQDPNFLTSFSQQNRDAVTLLRSLITPLGLQQNNSVVALAHDASLDENRISPAKAKVPSRVRKSLDASPSRNSIPFRREPVPNIDAAQCNSLPPSPSMKAVKSRVIPHAATQRRNSCSNAHAVMAQPVVAAIESDHMIHPSSAKSHVPTPSKYASNTNRRGEMAITALPRASRPDALTSSPSRVYKRRNTPSPYQRLEGAEAAANREQRMSPSTHLYEEESAYMANSAPSSTRTSPAMRSRRSIKHPEDDHLNQMMESPRFSSRPGLPFANSQHQMQQSSHDSVSQQQQQQQRGMQSHSYYSPDAAPLQSPTYELSPSDPNYHRWVQRRTQQLQQEKLRRFGSEPVHASHGGDDVPASASSGSSFHSPRSSGYHRRMPSVPSDEDNANAANNANNINNYHDRMQSQAESHKQSRQRQQRHGINNFNMSMYDPTHARGRSKDYSLPLLQSPTTARSPLPFYSGVELPMHQTELSGNPYNTPQPFSPSASKLNMEYSASAMDSTSLMSGFPNSTMNVTHMSAQSGLFSPTELYAQTNSAMMTHAGMASPPGSEAIGGVNQLAAINSTGRGYGQHQVVESGSDRLIANLHHQPPHLPMSMLMSPTVPAEITSGPRLVSHASLGDYFSQSSFHGADGKHPTSSPISGSLSFLASPPAPQTMSVAPQMHVPFDWSQAQTTGQWGHSSAAANAGAAAAAAGAALNHAQIHGFSHLSSPNAPSPPANHSHSNSLLPMMDSHSHSVNVSSYSSFHMSSNNGRYSDSNPLMSPQVLTNGNADMSHMHNPSLHNMVSTSGGMHVDELLSASVLASPTGNVNINCNVTNLTTTQPMCDMDGVPNLPTSN